MKQRPSLFRRTVVTVAAGLLVFQFAAGLAMFVNLVLPLGYRSANDLADLLVLSARIWSDRGREGATPSEPCMRFSRTRLSSRQFPYLDR